MYCSELLLLFLKIFSADFIIVSDKFLYKKACLYCTSNKDTVLNWAVSL